MSFGDLVKNLCHQTHVHVVRVVLNVRRYRCRYVTKCGWIFRSATTTTRGSSRQCTDVVVAATREYKSRHQHDPSSVCAEAIMRGELVDGERGLEDGDGGGKHEMETWRN